MSVFGVAQVVDVVFQVLIYLVIFRCILSFVRHDPYHPLLKFVYDVTEPVMAPFRRLLPGVGGVDFSPVVVILVIELVRKLVVDIIRGFAG
ncbi:MAG: YggT family protein [Syntrophomonadaceae bacterium]|nr:YggT family protein [Syntrophomonadaceae bacterium]